MRVCIIFRGDSVREKSIRNYVDILMCWNNLKKTIIDDLERNNNSVDVAFITYNNNIIENINNTIKPKYMYLYEKTTQYENFNKVLLFMKEHHNNYDRFIILRCDIMYNYHITKWPKWEEKGIMILNKDVHWPKLSLYSDLLFIVDSEQIEIFEIAHKGYIFGDTIHGLPGYLYINNIPFHLMYDGYYHMHIHPLLTIGSIDEEPDLHNPKIITSIQDISQWQ